MQRKSKYLGMEVDGWWKVDSTFVAEDKHSHYILKNSANGMTLEIDGRQLRAIIRGETTVSRVYHRKNFGKNEFIKKKIKSYSRKRWKYEGD